jgi:hypothetical protein
MELRPRRVHVCFNMNSQLEILLHVSKTLTWIKTHTECWVSLIIFSSPVLSFLEHCKVKKKQNDWARCVEPPLRRSEGDVVPFFFSGKRVIFSCVSLHRKQESLKGEIFRSRGYMYLLILCLFFIIFERPIGMVALSVNHMIKNLDQTLLYLFSSVSVEIALWSHVFLGLDGFPCWK